MKAAKDKSAKRGFTLIELAIVLMIMPIMAMTLVLPMIEVPKLFATIDADQEMGHQGRTAIQWLGRDVREAVSILPAGRFCKEDKGCLAVEKIEKGQPSAVVWRAEKSGLVRSVFSGTEFKDLTSREVMSNANPRLEVVVPQEAFAPLRVELVLEKAVGDMTRDFTITGEFAPRRTSP